MKRAQLRAKAGAMRVNAGAYDNPDFTAILCILKPHILNEMHSTSGISINLRQNEFDFVKNYLYFGDNINKKITLNE